MSQQDTLTIKAASNGWTLKTRSGFFVALTMAKLLEEVKSYALILQRDAILRAKENAQ